MVNDTIPTLGTYHEQLVLCISNLAAKDSKVLGHVVAGIIHAWPTSAHPNTPKEVLLLHELEEVMDMMPPAAFRGLRGTIVPVLMTSVASENYRVAERVLQMWKNQK